MHFLRTNYFTTIVFLTAISMPGVSSAIEIVRFNIEYFNSDPTPIVENHIMDVELFDDVTPLTVNNFLNYVNNGKYDESFFNRSLEGFIIQAGGFTFRPVLPTDILEAIDDTVPGGLEWVPVESTSPVQNEFDLTTVTNVRGTLAMAKIALRPDSATTEWFINLDDNRSNLDNQNSGFTVFGKIIDDGILFADHISLLPLNLFSEGVLGSNFSALPMTGYLLGDPVLQENLALIRNVSSSIVRPILRFTPAENTLPLDVVDGAGSTSLQIITLTNTGNETLTVSTIVDTLSAEFVVESDNCSNVTLEPISIIPGASCEIGIRYTAIAIGVTTSSLDISYTSLSSTYSVSLEVNAEGVSSPADLIINDIDLAASTVDVFFGLISPNVPEVQSLTLRNKGGTNLTINTLSLTNNVEFTIDNNGCTVGTVLALGESCSLIVTFEHTSASVITYDAVLSIISNANDLSIELRGIGVDPNVDAPTAVDFGGITVGQTDTQGMTITNIGTGLELESFVFTGVDANQFSFFTNCPGSIIVTNQNCQVFVTFSPDSEGTKTASLTIKSNASNTPTIISYSGSGAILSVPTINSSDANVVFANANVSTGDVSNHTLTLENIGIGSIAINSISIINDTENIFSFDSAGCVDGSILNSCDIIVSFSPIAGGNFTANLFIQTDFGDLDIPLSGLGDAPIIFPSVEDIYVGTSQLNGVEILAVEKRFTIINTGTQNLEVSDVLITGTNASEFSKVVYCTGVNQFTLATNFQCVIEVILTGQTAGSKTASLEFTSNDPASPVLTINLTGDTDKDVDGIPSTVEQLAPNNGDGNNDDIADEIQNNVASFTVGTDTQITLVSDNANLLLSTGAYATEDNEPATILLDIIVNDVPAEFPTDEDFDLGAYDFSIKVIGDIDEDTDLLFVDVAVFLPIDVYVDKFYRFGPTPDNSVPHLYDFTFDNTTGLGARSLGPREITDPKTGNTVERNVVIIRYLDGGLGDDDMTQNGFIANEFSAFSRGSPAVSNSSSSGTMSTYYLLLLVMTLTLVRLKNRNS